MPQNVKAPRIAIPVEGRSDTNVGVNSVQARLSERPSIRGDKESDSEVNT